MKDSLKKEHVLTALGLVTAAGVLLAAAPGVIAGDSDGAGAAVEDPYASLPAEIELTGIVRDFKAHGSDKGHIDFQNPCCGHVVGLVEEQLGSDGKPVLKSETGMRVKKQFRDADGNQINPAFYDAQLGDRAGTLESNTRKFVESAESFQWWFRDNPNYNLSAAHSITLVRQPGTNKYVFHQHDLGSTSEREGFFPVDGKLWNDMNGRWGHNYYLTYELQTEFVYEEGTGQTFTFFGDDDVWVFINGQLVIDLGGVKGAVHQTVDLDRLGTLRDGEVASLSLFFAERHTSHSNFRIETTMRLRSAELPNSFALYD
jgi:fibro-slime domain-containing protein